MAIAAGIWVLFFANARGEGAPGFEIAYFPEAMYRGDRAVFVIDAPLGQDIEALLNGVVLDRKTVEGTGVEWGLSIHLSGALVFRGSEGERAFIIVAPDTESVLTERDGYLYADGTPAILMPRQRHPPKKDRRWETIPFLTGWYRDRRPVVRDARLVMSSRAFGKVTETLPDGSDPETGSWRRTVVPVENSEIHAFITHMDGWSTGDTWVLALSDADLEAGTEWVRHRVKLEWMLQRLRHGGQERIFLVAPNLNETQRRRFAPWLSALETAVAGNEAFFIDPAKGRHANSFQDWFDAVRNAISVHVRFEP